MTQKPVVLYERLDKGLPHFGKLRLVFEDGSEMVATLREFEVTDEWEPNPDADPLRIIARWDETESDTPVAVDLISSDAASNEFWEHIWPSDQSDASFFHG